MNVSGDFLNTAELSALIKVPVLTLEKWRYLGRGPRWVKAGRAVRYRRRDVEAWAEQQTQGAA